MDCSFFCYHCQQPVELASNKKPGRSDTCDSCSADLHVCSNCKWFDENAYNECREPQAERVVDKEKRNFCDYFIYRAGKTADSSSEKDAALRKLDDLFK